MCVNNINIYTCGHSRVLNTRFCYGSLPHRRNEDLSTKLSSGWSFKNPHCSPYPGLRTDLNPSISMAMACKILSKKITKISCLCLSCLSILASGMEDEMMKFQLECNTNRHFWADWLHFIIYQTTPNDRPWIVQHRERAQAKKVFRQIRESIFRVENERQFEEECDLMQPD